MVIFYLLFFEEPHSPCSTKKMFEKQKGKQKENMDRFLTQTKANLGQAFDSSAYKNMCIDVYVYICMYVYLYVCMYIDR